MALGKKEVLDLISGQLLPAFQAENRRLQHIDKWYRWKHDDPHTPKTSTSEYRQLRDRAQAPWLNLVVTTVAQQLFVEGYRQANTKDNSRAWQWWQANGFDRRQIAIHRAALAYGLSYVTVLPGKAFTGEKIPVMRGVSPRRMIAFYADPAEDDWPVYALRADPAKVNGGEGYAIRVYDDETVNYVNADASGRLTWITFEGHGLGVCPIVRYTNQLDLEGRADGEVEPFIPLAARIDQTVFDRLVVQRFASWVVRTIAGMAKPETDEEAQAEKLRLRVEDLLVAEDPDTKFGSLPASDLSGFINAHESDIKSLAAVSQTPAHEMLGQMANLSAEALAAAEASLSRKVEERKHSLGEPHEQSLRLGSRVMGDTEGERDFSSQVRWRDMESRSLAQAADALGKIATMLGVPVEMLWEKIPGWTDQDVERAKALVDQGGGLEALMRQLAAAQTGPPAPPA